MILRFTVYRNIDRGGQSPLPLPPGGGNSPVKSVPRLLVDVHHHTCANMEGSSVDGGGVGNLDRAQMELWSRKHLDPGIPPSTYRAVSWCSRRNSVRSAKYNAWGSVSGREMQFESEEDKHIDKGDADTRTEPKEKPMAFKLQTSKNVLEGWRVLFVCFLFCFRVAWSRMWCKTGKSKLQGFFCCCCWETHHLWLR